MPRKSCASAAATSMTQQSNEWVRTSMLMSFAARRKNCLKFTSGDSRSSSLLMTALKHKLHGKSKERSNSGLQFASLPTCSCGGASTPPFNGDIPTTRKDCPSCRSESSTRGSSPLPTHPPSLRDILRFAVRMNCPSRSSTAGLPNGCSTSLNSSATLRWVNPAALLRPRCNNYSLYHIHTLLQLLLTSLSNMQHVFRGLQTSRTCLPQHWS